MDVMDERDFARFEFKMGYGPGGYPILHGTPRSGDSSMKYFITMTS